MLAKRAESVIITRKSAVLIGRGGTASVVFCEDGKPTVACELPGGFASDTEMSGLYSDEDGSFVRFNADYSDNVINPLVGTEYYSYFVERGYDSYIEQANAAMYYGHPKWGIFAPKEKLYLAGGAKLIRQQLCAGQNADYYSLSGGLTENGDTMRIYGFALHFDNTVWLITLKDHNGVYYYVTIKDPNGIGKNIDTVGELLGSVAASE
ncbi:MAG: hypothetical protein IJE90_07900 [Clostridia bacterium]|nr:hypothetical protein [Clostridia bacterium]